MELQKLIGDFYKLSEIKANDWLSALIALVGSLIIIFFRNLPRLISQKTKQKVILHDWKKDSKIFASIQDDVDKCGAIYSHVIQYHNHGPKKMSVLIESTGKPCKDCITKCSNQGTIRRLKEEWDDRPIDPFWLTRMALKTLELDGRVNHVNYDDLDTIHKEIWSDVNIYQFREILVKVKNDGFITLSFSFCSRFTEVGNVDAILTNLANRIYKYV